MPERIEDTNLWKLAPGEKIKDPVTGEDFFRAQNTAFVTVEYFPSLGKRRFLGLIGPRKGKMQVSDGVGNKYEVNGLDFKKVVI